MTRADDASIEARDARAFTRCIAGGGVALFPADTVYGLACDPRSEAAVARLYELKGRPPDKPAAVMFFSLARALGALPELGPRTRTVLEDLLPGPITLLLPNPERRFPLACGPDPSTLGLRVPALRALSSVDLAVLQSSANHSGEADALRLEDVTREIRDGVDLVLEGTEPAGTVSTVLDLRRYEDRGAWEILRSGLVGSEELSVLLSGG